MKKDLKRKYIIPAIGCLVVIIGLLYYYFFSSFSIDNNDVKYVYIDTDDNIDSVYTKLTPIASEHGMTGFRTLVRHSSYPKHIKTGQYAVRPGEGAFKVFRHIKNGLQTPVSLTIPSVRTLGRLSAEISKKLMLDSATIMNALSNESVCQKHGYDTTTIAGMFIPNTYDVYWDTNIDKFLLKMQKENRKFWNSERQQKAKAMKLSPNEVSTLASIIDEETANDAEKPMIAGMYYNRLMFRDAEYPQGMPLQADPTIKFAWKKFDLHRIYNNLLYIHSPYNTYTNTGLPPGPIRIPSIAGIDAVLNYVHHRYLYMCAKEDFSGTHNFAVTYQEHLQNAAKYAKALNERGIK
ncbi:YceG family protein [Prevotella sp. DNF00663]|uniref:endolytic transglycosylase MltG n=1 Tax=unclassified Prevotella TaxID=2638335 RepID=UPI00051480AF|nr:MULTISPECIES: endolytic transglycosylase MltG [unclassified Prevotella]KGI59588.1 aminodeoxychorismate lyase [Prevotella sp. S7 MS 2]KXB83417.1 YceG family protein [Prevotella sp. DNF00663]